MIIDTETHIFKKFAYSKRHPINPLVDHFTWHEYSGDLLVQEMNNAGVNKVICASYDLDDLIWYLKILSSNGEINKNIYDGGAKYTYKYISKYPDRLVWFDAINPLEEKCIEDLSQKAKIGLNGVKWLPAYYGKGSAVDGPEAIRFFEACVKFKFPVVISFEDITLKAPYTPSQYINQLDNVIDKFPDVSICLYHAGYVFSNMLEKEPTISLVNKYDNLFMSTAFYWLGEHEYPFPEYLAIIKELTERVGVEKMMWATDWPWTEGICKYYQMVYCIKNHATFLNEYQKEQFFGGTAIEFLRL